MNTESQQEWTHEKLQGLLRISNEDGYVTDDAFENSLDEINAALTAERQCREQAEQAANRNAETCASLVTELHQLSKSTATEREEQILTSLLSALAAIENCRKYSQRNNDIGGNISTGTVLGMLAVDLSLLHEHDAEVRKPLVDALDQIKTHAESALTCDLPSTESMDIEGGFEQLRDIACDALANVKESKC
jgi:hypothetical protein